MKVILLTLHGARLDAFGAYGGALAATPHFDRFASQAVVFDQHYASQLAATGSEETLADPAMLVLDELTAALTTSSGTSAYFADQRTMLSQSSTASWKTVCLVTERDLAALEQPTLSDAVLQQGIDWLQQFGIHYDSWLLNLELGALLPPWREEEFLAVPVEQQETPEAGHEPCFDFKPGTASPSPERFGWRAAYGGVMRYVDDLFGQFTKLLAELELIDQCMIIVQSSGGQPLGEYGPVADRSEGLFEERCHQPLMIRFPEAAGAGRRVHHYTQPDDVMATLYQGLLDKATVDLLGDDLRRYTQSKAARYREYAVTVIAGPDAQPVQASLRTQHWSIMVPLQYADQAAVQLYRKPEDRWDMNDVARQHTDVAEHLELTLRRHLAWQSQGCLGDAPVLREEVLTVVA